MTAAENGRTLIRYKLSYPAADFVFDVATYSVSGVVGGLRPSEMSIVNAKKI